MSTSYYGHRNVLRYCNRPFETIEEMDEALILRSNEIVQDNDYVVHVGDFTLGNKEFAASIIRRLKGNHIFIEGSHDRWLQGKAIQRWGKMINGIYVVCDHYPGYSWPRSHYGSFLLYGHHHGRLSIPSKALDVGVDTNNFYPYTFTKILELMKEKPDNPGYVALQNKLNAAKQKE